MDTYRAVLDDLNRAKLPIHTKFERIGEFRPPRKGEWYLSGAKPGAWLAFNDLDRSFQILRPVHIELPRQLYTGF